MPSVTPQKVSGSSLAPEVMVSLLFVLGGGKILLTVYQQDDVAQISTRYAGAVETVSFPSFLALIYH